MKFSPKAIDELRSIYDEIMAKSDWSGSAGGAHYLAVNWLKNNGIHIAFSSSRQLEDFIEHILVYGEAPDTEDFI
jgi:hypothetical protein